MAHRVRIDLPPDVRDLVEKAVRAALAACPDDDEWDVAILEDVRTPGQWEAVASGPKVEPGGDWEVLQASGRWVRQPETLYTRVFDGPAEQDPTYIHECFSELFRCFERADS
jgi:hypothetical protein